MASQLAAQQANHAAEQAADWAAPPRRAASARAGQSFKQQDDYFDDSPPDSPVASQVRTALTCPSLLVPALEGLGSCLEQSRAPEPRDHYFHRAGQETQSQAAGFTDRSRAGQQGQNAGM